MNAFKDSRQIQASIGIDVGGTKCAAGLVEFPAGHVLARRRQPTRPERGGDAVLADVIEVARSLQREAADRDAAPRAIGLGVAELVGVDGRVLSQATIAWRNVDVARALTQATGLPACVEADVRAAARGEACLGAGRAFRSFLCVSVGTGISASLVIDCIPYVGARGLTGTFASSPGLIPGDDGCVLAGPSLELFAGGPALARRLAAVRPNFAGTAFDVLSLASSGDALALTIVASAGEALGAAIGQLVNVLDPEAVVIAGGLGLAGGQFRQSIEAAMRLHIWSEIHRGLPLLSAELGDDAGLVGAALSAQRH